MTFHDHFSPVSSPYAEFRPRYPAALFDWIAAAAPGHDLAWDCATGNGQAALGLATRFRKVIATDASARQIAAATPDARIEYRVAPADASGLASASCDLVTVAQALHWFDLGKFWPEARRVLRPGGLLAVWLYVFTEFDHPPLDHLFHHFWAEVVGPYWPPERALVNERYRSVALPFPELETPNFAIEVEWTLQEFLGYLGTWSAVHRYRTSTDSDPVDAIAPRFADLWGDDPAGKRHLRFPITLRAAKRP